MAKHPLSPDDNFEVQNENVEVIMKEIGELLKTAMPEGWGFTLLMFDFVKGEGGSTFYISNAQRSDMLKLMKEFIEKQEAKNG